MNNLVSIFMLCGMVNIIRGQYASTGYRYASHQPSLESLLEEQCPGQDYIVYCGEITDRELRDLQRDHVKEYLPRGQRRNDGIVNSMLTLFYDPYD